MSIEDERAAVWQAIQVNGDRITEVRDTMHDTITRAVKDAMPKALMTDDQHRFLQELIERQQQGRKFRQKIIESSAVWAIPLLILALMAIFREYAIAHGMWKP